jgi:hypothetical protein
MRKQIGSETEKPSIGKKHSNYEHTEHSPKNKRQSKQADTWKQWEKSCLPVYFLIFIGPVYFLFHVDSGI